VIEGIEGGRVRVRVMDEYMRDGRESEYIKYHHLSQVAYVYECRRGVTRGTGGVELSINKGLSTFVTSDIRLFLIHIELILRVK
jgi:hypothetical protein